jgi:hypothetical protein
LYLYGEVEEEAGSAEVQLASNKLQDTRKSGKLLGIMLSSFFVFTDVFFMAKKTYFSLLL